MIATEILNLLKEKEIEAEIIGDANCEIEQVSGLAEAEKKHLSFFNDPKRIQELKKTSAGIVFLNKAFIEDSVSTAICVQDPYVAYAIIAQHLNPVRLKATIANSAVIADSASVPASCQIAENVVIGESVILGENCFISAGSVIKENCVLGKNVAVGSNVTIEKNCLIGDDSSIEAGTVIGGQGFGFANNQGEWLRIPQIGRVIVGNNVWIGNNCAIDRGTINDTIIEDNCIIDNLVHIAHNVQIGYGSAIAGQVGFAGSTQIGRYNIFAGQVGVTGHIETADNCLFGAKAGVTHSIKSSGSYSGFPAIETAKWQKNTVRVKTLDKTSKKIKQLEKRIRELEENADGH